MKRILSVATVVAMLFASCANNDELSQSVLVVPSEDFTASIDSEARTSLDGTAVVWNEEDLLTIFTKTSHNRQYKVKNIADGGRTATFGYVGYTGSDNTAIAENYAVYPYDANATLVDGVLATSLSATQTYNNANGNLSYALMAAKSANNSFAFENAGALMRFKVKSVIPDTFTLKSIKVASTANNIAGDVTIDLNGEECKAVAATTGVKEITLADINTVVADEESEFYVAMLATNFGENDLIVTFSFEEGDKVFTLPAFNLAQGRIKTVAYNIADTDDFTGSTPGVGDATDEPTGPANNEIWYTTTTNDVVTPYATDVFGANITSNTYENGKGIIKFDGDVTSIGDYAFCKCYKLTSITIPNSVTSIGKETFLDCNYLTAFYGKFASEDNRCLIANGVLKAFAGDGITDYTIPDGVTSIEDYTFSYLNGFKSVTIPDSVTSIGANAFWQSHSIIAFYGKFASEDNLCLIVDGVLISFAVSADVTEYTIPNSVTKIPSYIFSSCSNLTSVIIPDSVTSIGQGAFYYCSKLTSIYCEPTTPPTGGYNLFSNIVEGRKIYVPSTSVEAYKSAQYWSDYAKYIVGYDFENGEVVEPTTPTGPANNEIWYTTTDGNIVTSPTSGTFYNQKSNTYADGKGVIVFNSDVTSISSNQFKSLTKLKSVVIPDSVREIGMSSFSGCSSLKSATLGSGVTYIDENAFNNCTALVEIYCKATTPPSVENVAALGGLYTANKKIYVPTASVDAYKKAKNWSSYSSMIVGYDF